MTRPEPTPPESDVLARLFGDLGRVDLAKRSAHLMPVELEPREAVFDQGSPGWIQWRLAAAPPASSSASGPGPVAFAVAVALVSVVARVVLELGLTVLLASLTLLPLASRVGAEPWVVMLAVLVTSVAWTLPTQTQAYRVAVAAPEGRLHSPEQARRFPVGYTAVTVAAFVL